MEISFIEQNESHFVLHIVSYAQVGKEQETNQNGLGKLQEVYKEGILKKKFCNRAG